MSAIWLILALIYLCNAQNNTGSPCTTPDGKTGDCKTFETCRPLRKLVQNGDLQQKPTVETLNLIRASHCGYEEVTYKPKVCCPCVTLANKTEAGQCVDINQCDHIRTRLATPRVPQQYKDYVYSLRCEGTASFSVCCGPPPESMPTPIATPTPVRSIDTPTTHVINSAPPSPSEHGNTVACTMSAQPPDPASGCCGIGFPRFRDLSGTVAGIDEYPWLALIEYEREHQIKLLCGGVLISGRYVLTAAHCVVGPVLRVNIPKNVRLGEYDTAKTRDCVVEEGGEEGDEECTLDPVIIPIEQIIAHPDYNVYARNRRNDIALLRLASVPEYTEFVRPICLPSVDNTESFQGSESLYAAGWGAVINMNSNIKQYVTLPFKTLEVCQQAYNVSMRRLSLWDRQMCAGGESDKDTCKSDSGGPLMHYREMNHTKSHFEVIGILSFGVTPCGIKGIPSVYTKVFEYLSWIHSNIQP